jgi:anti-sigma B factor antagonist
MFTIQEAKRNGHPVLKLTGDLTIYSATEARTTLAEHLNRKGALPELDLSGLEEIDTAGVQVLLWLKREAQDHKKAMPFANHSPAVIEVFDLLKIAGLLGDPILIPPPSR